MLFLLRLESGTGGRERRLRLLAGEWAGLPARGSGWLGGDELNWGEQRGGVDVAFCVCVVSLTLIGAWESGSLGWLG